MRTDIDYRGSAKYTITGCKNSQDEKRTLILLFVLNKTQTRFQTCFPSPAFFLNLGEFDNCEHAAKLSTFLIDTLMQNTLRIH